MGSNPTESIAASQSTQPATASLIRMTALGCTTQHKPMHHPVRTGWEGSNAPDLPPRRVMRPCIRAIQASTGPSTL